MKLIRYLAILLITLVCGNTYTGGDTDTLQGLAAQQAKAQKVPHAMKHNGAQKKSPALAEEEDDEEDPSLFQLFKNQCAAEYRWAKNNPKEALVTVGSICAALGAAYGGKTACSWAGGKVREWWWNWRNNLTPQEAHDMMRTHANTVQLNQMCIEYAAQCTQEFREKIGLERFKLLGLAAEHQSGATALKRVRVPEDDIAFLKKLIKEQEAVPLLTQLLNGRAQYLKEDNAPAEVINVLAGYIAEKD